MDTNELTRLFRSYRGFPRIALAVSGGSDSLALMHLSLAWQRVTGAPKPDFVILTVDHGLRPAAAGEAQAVAKAAQAWGLACEILARTPPASKTSIQDVARTDRYRLLCEAARRHGATAIATGHTADDQAETLLMRLARGSGVDGLAAMAPVSRIEDLVLLRPLLGCSKFDLQKVLIDRGVAWTEDPSNTDPAFERPRLRAPGLTLSSAGLTREPLALSARRLGRARAALEAARDEANSRLVTLHQEGWVSLPRLDFDRLPEEIRLRLLDFWLRAMGTSQRYQRLSALEKIVADIASQQAVVTTLSGCTIVASELTLNMVRETGRMGLPQVELQPGGATLWDRRFWVRLPATASASVLIRTVKRADLVEGVVERVAQKIDYHVLEFAPAAFRDGKMVASLALDIALEPVGFELALPHPKAASNEPALPVFNE